MTYHHFTTKNMFFRLLRKIVDCCLFSQAPKDPLRHGLGAALAGRLVRQTDQDGLKWDLLKQVLRVRTLPCV